MRLFDLFNASDEDVPREVPAGNRDPRRWGKRETVAVPNAALSPSRRFHHEDG